LVGWLVVDVGWLVVWLVVGWLDGWLGLLVLLGWMLTGALGH
jgi:hypothetical protein